MKNNQTFAATSQNITCEGMASFLFCLPVHDTWQSLSSFSDSNFFESQNRKSSFRNEYTIYGAYFEANSNPKMMKGRSSSFKIIWGRTKFWVKNLRNCRKKSRWRHNDRKPSESYSVASIYYMRKFFMQKYPQIVNLRNFLKTSWWRHINRKRPKSCSVNSIEY